MFVHYFGCNTCTWTPNLFRACDNMTWARCGSSFEFFRYRHSPSEERELWPSQMRLSKNSSFSRDSRKPNTMLRVTRVFSRFSSISIVSKQTAWAYSRKMLTLPSFFLGASLSWVRRRADSNSFPVSARRCNFRQNRPHVKPEKLTYGGGLNGESETFCHQSVTAFSESMYELYETHRTNDVYCVRWWGQDQIQKDPPFSIIRDTVFGKAFQPMVFE